jgi:uncharacterized protein YdeI (BOF family)
MYVHAHPSIKRDLTLALLVSAFVFVCALAWGHPFIGTGSDAFAAAAPVQAQQSEAKSVILSGTIQRDGEQFFLREASGQIYRLDDPQHAQAFEGQAVKVTGKLDTQTRLIHVEHIEAVMS